jgi:hypothetical protein
MPAFGSDFVLEDPDAIAEDISGKLIMQFVGARWRRRLMT